MAEGNVHCIGWIVEASAKQKNRAQHEDYTKTHNEGSCQLAIDKALRLTVRRIIWILASDTALVNSTIYLQIFRRQCCLVNHGGVALFDTALFKKNEYFVWMNILDFKKMNNSFEWIFWILKKWIFVLNEYSGFL